MSETFGTTSTVTTGITVNSPSYPKTTTPEHIKGYTDFGFPKKVINNYMYGDCVYFAQALADENPDYEPILISDFSSPDIEECFYHAVVATPDGRYYDIRGEWEAWDSLSKSFPDVDPEEIWGESITVDLYIDMGGHDQTYTTRAGTEEIALEYIEKIKKNQS